MQKEPLASAVIITYNQEKYIAQVIDCALAQKVDFPYEIVIGEDCSTDRTREICLQYQEKYPDIIRVITSDKNVGLLDNWYRSVKAARGKYIAGCGGDDYWHNPDKMQKQVHFLEENPDYGMVHSEANMYFEKSGYLLKNYHQSNGRVMVNDSANPIALLFQGKYWIIACTALYHKSLFQRCFDLDELKENAIMMEDIPMWFEISACSKLYFMQESCSTYQNIEGTLSRPQSFERKLELWESCYRCHLYYYKKYRSKIPEGMVSSEMIHSNFNRIFFNLAFQDNLCRRARGYYRKLLNQKGNSPVTRKDKCKYALTYFPLGTRLCNWMRYIIKLRRI